MVSRVGGYVSREAYYSYNPRYTPQEIYFNGTNRGAFGTSNIAENSSREVELLDLLTPLIASKHFRSNYRRLIIVCFRRSAREIPYKVSP